MNSSSTISSPAEAALGIHRNTAALVLASGVFSILTIHIVRGYSPTSSVFGLALGSGPNFIAALCMPVAVPALASLALRRGLPRLSPQRWALICFAVTQLVFVAWEFLQLAVRTMMFDVTDLKAAALGGAFWFVFANILSRKEA